MAEIRSRIAGTGKGLPSRVVTNQELSTFVETSDEWIRTRTGIRERRLIDPKKGENHSQLSTQAARQALERAGCKPEDVELIIACTLSAETDMPNASSRIQDALGCHRAGAIDLNAACSGFLSGLHVADGLIRAGIHKKIVVVGAEIFSAYVDWKDRSTCVLFGDGAGAALIEATEVEDVTKDSCVLGSVLHALFDKDENLSIQGGGSRHPAGEGVSAKVQMTGSEVFKNASRCMAESAAEVLRKCNMKLGDVRWFVPHQANRRIIEMVAKLMEFPMDKVFINLDRWGNTSAATIPICLAEMAEQNLVQKGDVVLLDVFGGGYTYGAALVRW